jgi:hypothetical protein
MRASLRQVLFRSAGLDLNFAGGVFSLNNTRTDSPANIPGWSFSRTDTNGIATALDLAGNVIQFATGVPRITNRGILVEEARTNLLLNSATLSTQTVTTTAVAHTLSFYGTGTVTLTGASTAGPLVGTGANNRVTLTFTPIVGPLLLTVTGSVTMAQVEIGSFATSPIITTGAAGTRGVDSAFVTGLAGLPPFTLITDGDTGASSFPQYGAVDDGTSANRVAHLRVGSANNAYAEITSGGGSTGVNVGPTGAVFAGQTTKIASSVTSAGFRASRDGSAIATAARTVNALNRLCVGTVSGTLPANGYIRRVRVLPFAATDAQLQALTAP